MKRSTEIEKLIGDSVVAYERGDVAFVERTTSKQPGVVSIGTDANEFVLDYEPIINSARGEMDSSPHMRVQLGKSAPTNMGTWVGPTGRDSSRLTDSRWRSATPVSSCARQANGGACRATPPSACPMSGCSIRSFNGTRPRPNPRSQTAVAEVASRVRAISGGPPRALGP